MGKIVQSVWIPFFVSVMALLILLPWTRWILANTLGESPVERDPTDVVYSPPELANPNGWRSDLPWTPVARAIWFDPSKESPTAYRRELVEALERWEPRDEARRILVRLLPNRVGYDMGAAEPLREIARYADDGSKLQPKNAFFPLMGAAASAALRDDERAKAFLRQAAAGNSYDDGLAQEARRNIDAVERTYGYRGEGLRLGVMFAQSIPYLSLLSRELKELIRRNPGDVALRKDAFRAATVGAYQSDLSVVVRVCAELARRAMDPRLAKMDRDTQPDPETFARLIGDPGAAGVARSLFKLRGREVSQPDMSAYDVAKVARVVGYVALASIPAFAAFLVGLALWTRRPAAPGLALYWLGAFPVYLAGGRLEALAALLLGLVVAILSATSLRRTAPLFGWACFALVVACWVLFPVERRHVLIALPPALWLASALVLPRWPAAYLVLVAGALVVVAAGRDSGSINPVLMAALAALAWTEPARSAPQLGPARWTWLLALSALGSLGGVALALRADAQLGAMRVEYERSAAIMRAQRLGPASPAPEAPRE